MTLEMLTARIRTLELQLAVLKASVEKLGARKPTRSFADLYGILKGKVESTEEEIKAAEYKVKWDDTEE
jgi:hypothetical protein